jgi:hypothetical protein
MKKEYHATTQRIDELINQINRIRWDNPDMIEGSKKSEPLYREYQELKQKELNLVKKKIKNKNFYYKTSERKATYGWNVKAEVFKNTKTGIARVGETNWNTGSYKGEESEILDELVKQKLLPKEVLNISKSPSGGKGYYNSDLRDIIKIRKI